MQLTSLTINKQCKVTHGKVALTGAGPTFDHS